MGFGRRTGPISYHYNIAAKNLGKAEEKFKALIGKRKIALKTIDKIGEVIL